MLPFVMEPEQDIEPAARITPLGRVAVWLKYLAILSFIAAAFIASWIGYNRALVQSIEVDRMVSIEAPAPIPVKSSVSVKELLKNFYIRRTAEGTYALRWIISEEVQNTYSPLSTAFIDLRLVPEGEGLDYTNEKGVPYRLSTGFAFDQNTYEFSPKRYEEEYSWSYNPGERYQITAQIIYSPSQFECDPDPKYGKDCMQIFSENDKALISKAQEYLFVSEPFVLD